MHVYTSLNKLYPNFTYCRWTEDARLSYPINELITVQDKRALVRVLIYIAV